MIRSFYLTFFTNDQTIQLYDLKNKKIFLSRVACPEIQLKDIYIGAFITCFSRKLRIVDYADAFTRSKHDVVQKTFAMIKPNALPNIGNILQVIQEAGLSISNLKMTKMRRQDAQTFYAEHHGKGFFDNLVNFMTSDYVVGMELVGKSAITHWRTLLGPTNSLKAKEEAPNSIRGRFGKDGTQNACHGSDSPESAAREINFFFSENSPLQTTAKLNACSCLIIKPHVLEQKKCGQLIQSIQDRNLTISALQMFYLDRATCDEFFEVYKDVLPEFNAISENTSKGPVLVLEIQGDNAVQQVRAICGPHDPKIAQTLHPDSLRAHFGIDRVKNAVHCTDLEEDGSLECNYFFSILQN